MRILVGGFKVRRASESSLPLAHCEGNFSPYNVVGMAAFGPASNGRVENVSRLAAWLAGCFPKAGISRQYFASNSRVPEVKNVLSKARAFRPEESCETAAGDVVTC